MPKRAIVAINEDLCDGCGVCVSTCAEAALEIVNGKARLIHDSYCDGLGACINCPQNAITIIEREAEDFDESRLPQAEAHHREPKLKQLVHLGENQHEQHRHHGHGHRGHHPGHHEGHHDGHHEGHHAHAKQAGTCCHRVVNFQQAGGIASNSSDSLVAQISSWPLQLHLVPETAPFFSNANVLLAAHCTAFAMPNIYQEWLQGKILVIACPKLGQHSTYLDKLTAILQNNQLASFSILRIDLPCCSALTRISQQAIELANSNLQIREDIVKLP